MPKADAAIQISGVALSAFPTPTRHRTKTKKSEANQVGLVRCDGCVERWVAVPGYTITLPQRVGEALRGYPSEFTGAINCPDVKNLVRRPAIGFLLVGTQMYCNWICGVTPPEGS